MVYSNQRENIPAMQDTVCTVPLSTLNKGETATIIGFSEKGQELFNRLFELGFVNGSTITADGKAPLGNPLMFTIHGGKLALRKEDAKYVLVTKVCQ